MRSTGSRSGSRTRGRSSHSSGTRSASGPGSSPAGYSSRSTWCSSGLDLILFGATLNGIIVAHGGPDIPWWLLMLIGLVLIWGVAVLGIRLSVRSDLALLTFELAVLLALAITILAKGAPGGDWHAHVFSPSASPAGFSGVVVGAVFGVLAFTGFEAPAYLGEEADEAAADRAAGDPDDDRADRRRLSSSSST